MTPALRSLVLWANVLLQGIIVPSGCCLSPDLFAGIYKLQYEHNLLQLRLWQAWQHLIAGEIEGGQLFI